MKLNQGMNITKYGIAHLTAKPYLEALTSETLVSAFKKTRISSFNKCAITDSKLASSIIFTDQTETPEMTNEPNKNDEHRTPNTDDTPQPLEKTNFFVKRTITKAIKPKPKRFVPPFKMTGNILHERNVEQLTAQTNKNQPSSVTNKQPAPTNEPCQGPSGMCNPNIGIHSADDAKTDDYDSDADTETCCMCDRFEPANLDKFTL